MSNIDKSSQPSSTLEDLKSKFKFAKECFEQKIPLKDDLFDYFATFLVWVENDPLETVYAQPDLKQYFFEEFVGGLAKRLSLLKEASNESLHSIKNLVMLLARIAVKEIGRDNSDMADAMRYLLDPSAPLH